MRANLRTFLRARVPVLPVLGFVALGAGLWAVVAWAESLQEKQYEAAQAAAVDCDTVAGGCHYLVLGGLTTGNVVTRLTTNAAGELQVGEVSGSDVTLGTFSATAGTPVQIFLAGGNMPAAGATVALKVILNVPADNTASIWVGETSALAVARNNGISPSGQDTWAIPANGTLYFDAASGTQRVSARIRTP